MKDKQKMNFRAAGGRKYSIHARSTHTKYLVGLLVGGGGGDGGPSSDISYAS